MPAANGEPCTAAGGQIGACVSGSCVASGGAASPPVDAGGVDSGVDAGTPMATKGTPKKSGCSFAPGGDQGSGVLALALLGLVVFLRRRR
jgi:MYXO-CTERM domain-containing protein